MTKCINKMHQTIDMEFEKESREIDSGMVAQFQMKAMTDKRMKFRETTIPMGMHLVKGWPKARSI